MVRKLRPNEVNLLAKKEWLYRAGGWAQFALQLYSLRIPGLATNFKLVLIAIMDRVRPKGQGGAFPTLENIAENVGVERTTVWRALKFWKAKGVIDWKGGIGVFWSNEYTLKASPLSLRTPKARVKCCNLQPTHVATCNMDMLHSATLTSTEEITDRKSNSTPSGTDTQDGRMADPSEGPGGGLDMGLWGTQKKGGDSAGGEKAMDKGERESKQKGYYRKAKAADEAWTYMMAKAKERMGVDLPPLRGWEGQKVGELVESDGYGIVKVRAMIDSLTLNWAGAKKALRIKEDSPSWNTLVFFAQQLIVKKGEPFGSTAGLIDPDLEEKAKNAKFGEIV